MGIFRKITVRGKSFLWTYSFDDYDYQLDSNIVIKDCGKKGKLVVRFRAAKGKDGWGEHGKCPFNKGLHAKKGGEEVVLNLNRPKFAAEILEHILDNRPKGSEFDSTEYYDGISILNDLGYTFDYHLSW